MNIQRLVIAIVVNYLVLLGLGWLLFMQLFAEQLAPLTEGVSAGEMQPWVFVAYLVQVALFCLIFPRGYEGRGIMEGVRYGLWLGGLLAAADVVWALHVQPALGTALLSAVLTLVMWVAAGAILAAIYKPKTESATAAA